MGNENKTRGIDISKHQGSIDFSKVKNDGIRFVILREGYSSTIDPKFLEFASSAKNNGIPVVGVYHFLYSLKPEDAAAEAKRCIENVKKAGLGKDVIIFSDFEYDTVDNAKKKHGVILGRSDCISHTRAFCEEVTNAGYRAGIYSNLDYYRNMYNEDLMSKYIVWLADYSGGPNFECSFQQYSSTGKVNGINGNVDMDYCFIDILSAHKDAEPTVTKKPNDVIADEVIAGKWGNGSQRTHNLACAGYDAAAIQSIVNQKLNTPKPQTKTTTSSTSGRKIVKASKPASKIDKSLAKKYTATANLYLRDGAGTNNVALVKMPKGHTVQCYGYYSISGNEKWLYVSTVLENVQYDGFCCARYLK